jgi:hypothetical protein
VNLADFNVLAANFGQDGRTWQTADFNRDGVTNLSDFNVLAANFGLSASPQMMPDDWANLAAAEPEPTAPLSLLTTAMPLLRRRSRRAGRARDLTRADQRGKRLNQNVIVGPG